MSPQHISFSRRSLGVSVAISIAIGASVILFMILLNNSLAPTDAMDIAGAVASQAEQPASTPNAGSVTELFLPLVAQQAEPQSAVSGEEAPPPLMAASSGHSGRSPVSPPPAARQTFVADIGGDLDRYLFRSDLAGGRLKFTVNIAAPVIKDARFVDADGWLTDAGLQQMKSERKLSDFSVLQLHVYDVDDDSPFCVQADHLWINGRRLEQGGTPAVLRGDDKIWNTWTVLVPTQMLRFPVYSGDDAQTSQPAANEIAIAVDTKQCFRRWALEVDWGAVSVRPSLTYGLFFVHGWTGDDTTFGDFYGYAQQDNYLAFGPKNYSKGIEPLVTTALSLTHEIAESLLVSETDKVFIVAHSRGGLFVRQALRSNEENIAEKVAGYVTLSTPHHGIYAADQFASSILCIPLDYKKCKEAARLLRVEEMWRFNYGDKCHEKWWINPLTGLDILVGEDCYPQWSEQERTNAYSVVGGRFDVDPYSATFPWDSVRRPFPQTPNVDQRFGDADHNTIHSNENVYQYVLGLYSSLIFSDHVGLPTATAFTEAALPPLQWQPTFLYTDVVSAGQAQSVTVSVAAATTVSFRIMTRQPVSVTLIRPDGEQIDPDTLADNPQVFYSVVEPGVGDAYPVWYY